MEQTDIVRIASHHMTRVLATVSHLQEVDDPGGFLSTPSNRLQDPAAGHHLPSDGVHAGTGQGLLKHRLHREHAQTGLR